MNKNFKFTQLKTINVNGNKITYREVGESNGVPLILLHHLTAIIDDWDPYVVDRLATGRKVIAFNSIGVGSSDGVTPDSIEVMADVAIAFIKELGLEKVDLFGYSMGGFVAQVISSRHPDMVRKMILADTAAAGGIGLDKIWDIVQESFVYAEREKKHPKHKLFFKQTKDGQIAADEFLYRLQAPFTQADDGIKDESIQKQVTAFIKWAKSSDDYTQNIITPTLIVTGDADEMIPISNSFNLAERIKNSNLAIYPNGGHGAIFQFGNLFTLQAEEFLNSQQYN